MSSAGRDPARQAHPVRPGSKERWYTIVGIVPDVVMDEAGKVDDRHYPVLQDPTRFMSIAMRGEGDPRALVGAVRTALDPDRPEPRALLAAHIRRIARHQDGGIPHHRDDLRGVRGRRARARRRRPLRCAGIPCRPAYPRDRRAACIRRRQPPDPRVVMRASGLQIGLGIVIGMALLPFMARGSRQHSPGRKPVRPVHLQHGARAHDVGRDRRHADADASRVEDRSGGGIALRVRLDRRGGLRRQR